MEISDDNMQAVFKEALTKKELKGLFAEDIVAKFDFLVTVNPLLNYNSYRCLSEPQVRRQVAAKMKQPA
jgi:hypothetical protein